MCLDLKPNTKKQIATKDIVCYKRILIDQKSINGQYAGKSFTGIIRGIECEGKIQIENEYVYFCTNDPFLNGMRCNNRLGYKYSYAFCDRVESIIIDGVDIMISIKNSIFMTPYQRAEVKLGETYTSELIREDDEIGYDVINIGYDVINIGLHSFTTYEDARRDGGGVIVKCIIPKGAEYYEGIFCFYPSYASTKLKYIEIVTK